MFFFPKAPFNSPSKSLMIFAFTYANSIGVYGSPIQASKGAIEVHNRHQFLQRDDSNSSSSGSDGTMRRIISVVVVLLAFLAFVFVVTRVKYSNARRRQNLEARNLQSLPSQGPSASGTERTRQRQREYSTHSLPAYTNEPGKSEQLIIREVPAPSAERRLDDVDEESVTDAESCQESQSPSQIALITPPLENHTADDSSSSNSPVDSHRPSGSDTDTKVRTVDNLNPTASNMQGESPPPYVEAVDQRSTS